MWQRRDVSPGAPKLHQSLRQSARREDGDAGGEHNELEEEPDESESADGGGWQMLASIRRRPEGEGEGGLEGMEPKKKRGPAVKTTWHGDGGTWQQRGMR